jgi:predicted nucleic acid-binding protein
MYCDSCILIKLLTSEEDSAVFERELRGRPLGTSELSITEVCSALLAKERSGRILPNERQRAWTLFNRWIDEEILLLHPLNPPTVRKAAWQLEQCHPRVALRTLDALHLATADLTQDLPLCTTDQQMRQAAMHLALPLFPSE